jgi:hypothetical protein
MDVATDWTCSGRQVASSPQRAAGSVERRLNVLKALTHCCRVPRDNGSDGERSWDRKKGIDVESLRPLPV